MNEQINDLMYHAGLTAQGCWDSMDDYDHQAIMKFAELIVQECCDIFVELRTRPADLAVKDVKKHFGVEE